MDTSILLAIIFIVNNEPVISKEFHPIEQPTLEVCNTRKEFTANYLELIDDHLPGKYHIVCGTLHDIRLAVLNLNADPV